MLPKNWVSSAFSDAESQPVRLSSADCPPGKVAAGSVSTASSRSSAGDSACLSRAKSSAAVSAPVRLADAGWDGEPVTASALSQPAPPMASAGTVASQAMSAAVRDSAEASEVTLRNRT